MSKRLLFIYNPKAGKEKIKNHMCEILDEFALAGYEICVAPTLARGDCEVFASKSSPMMYDLICVSGGDGTLDEAVTGLLTNGINMPIGYIPGGSTNDFGNTLKLPKFMGKAARVAVRGRDYLCDVGKFNDRYFVYVAAFGLFTSVTYNTPQAEKNLLGYGAYVLEGVKSLADVRTYNLHIEIDGAKYTGDYLLGIISNSDSVGGMRKITGPDVALDDGLFEVLFIRKPPTIIELNEALAAMIDRDISSDYVISMHATKVTVECDEAIAWTLDGEYGGDVKKASVSVVSKGITIRVP